MTDKKKVWKSGDTVTFEKLNELQEKADKYDELMKSQKPPKQANKKDEEK